MTTHKDYLTEPYWFVNAVGVRVAVRLELSGSFADCRALSLLTAMQSPRVGLPDLIIRTITIIFLALAGCTSAEKPVPPAAQTAAPATTPKASPVAAVPKTGSSPAPLDRREIFEQAEDKAASASSIAQSAQSKDDWSLVISQWQEAIELLKVVPSSDPQGALAKKRIAEYQRRRAYAQQQLAGIAKPKVRIKVATASAVRQPTAARKPTAQPSNVRQPTAPKALSPAVPAEVSLANHLRKTGAKMYGTYWCSACQWQERQFGKEAFRQINYIECDPAGKNPRLDLCRQAKIRAFPTWEINGRFYRPGGYPLVLLAELSGYKGSRNFRN